MNLKDVVKQRFPSKTAQPQRIRLATSTERLNAPIQEVLPDHVFSIDFSDDTVEFLVAETDDETKALKDLAAGPDTTVAVSFAPKVALPDAPPVIPPVASPKPFSPSVPTTSPLKPPDRG